MVFEIINNGRIYKLIATMLHLKKLELENNSWA